MTGRVLHINAGESGFLARVAAPVMAAVFDSEVENGAVVIEGRGTLMARPMSQLCDTLSAVGVECRDRMPLRLGGRIRPGSLGLTVQEAPSPFPGLCSPCLFLILLPKSLWTIRSAFLIFI